MAVFKVTTLFQFASAASSPTAPLHRTAGWSESWYINAASVQAVLNFFNGIGLPAGQPGFWQTRAVLLPVGTAITGYRIQSVSPLGPTQSGAIMFPGVPGQLADTPQTTLLCKAPGLGVSNIRRFGLRGVPDAQVTEGEYAPGGSFGVGVPIFFQSLAGLSFRGRDLSQPTTRVISITAAGLAATETLYPGAVNDMVRVLKTVDSGKNLRGGRFQVTAIGPGNTVTLMNWPFGATTLGTVRKDAIVYPGVDSVNTNFSRIIIRKVGAPFVRYRGRRSKRR